MNDMYVIKNKASFTLMIFHLFLLLLSEKFSAVKHMFQQGAVSSRIKTTQIKGCF